MSRLHKVSGGGSSARGGAVVFVHGLGGDPSAQLGDRAKERLASGRLGSERISPGSISYTLEYAAHASAWQGPAMALPDRAANVLAELVAERLDERPLVFVCHSLGGLIVKQALRIAADQPGTPMGRILDRTQGVVFLATPERGLRSRDLDGPAAYHLAAECRRPKTLRPTHLTCAISTSGTQSGRHAKDIATLVFVENGRDARGRGGRPDQRRSGYPRRAPNPTRYRPPRHCQAR